MGYILKNTSGLINTKVTDTARRKISEGKFNISYFQIGDSEVSYNTLPSSYDQTETEILEPESNSQNSAGSPQSNKHNIKYPYYVDAGSTNTFGIPFMSSINIPVYNRSVMRGFFTGDTTATTISWSALTNNKYAINTNYVVDMSTLVCSNSIELITSSCYTDPVRGPQAGDFITIYFDGKGLNDCSCIYPTPTPTPSPSAPSGTTTTTSTTTTTTDPCITPSPTPTPSTSCCPTPTPSPQCPLPDPANCSVSIDSCHHVLTYKITRVCGSTIYLDRNTPDFSQYGGCYGRVIIYPGDINEIYDSYTPRPHWNDNVIDFESVCGIDALDVKIWNMNIPWSESPAGLNNAVYQDYTYFGSKQYLGTKEYFGYASESGQVFVITGSTTALTDTYYYNSLGDKVLVYPEEQKTIAIIHYTNNTIDFFYGEKFALEPYDISNPDDTTGQARNFKLHIPWLMWHKNPNCCNGETFYVDPPNEEFEDLGLLNVKYIQSTKNPNMNNPGIRYYHLWDTHQNIDGYPSRVGKVFPDHKLIVIDDEELVASMSYKSNRNWTLPAPRLSLITPNTCGNDNNSVTGILTGNGQTLYVTYKLSDEYTCSQNLHCNYYPNIIGPNLNCNNIDPQNVAVRFGPEFSCLNTSLCWNTGFTFVFSASSFSPNTIVRAPFENTGGSINGKPLYYSLSGGYIYWDGNNWVLDDVSGLVTVISGGTTPLGSLNYTSDGVDYLGYTTCENSYVLCLTTCEENLNCESNVIFNFIGDGVSVYGADMVGVVGWSAGSSSFVYTDGTTVFGQLTGLTENDLPVGTFIPYGDFTGITSSLLTFNDLETSSCIPFSCSCISITADTGDELFKYVDCNGILHIQNVPSGSTFSACVINETFYQVSGNSITGTCLDVCTGYTTTTTTLCPEVCSIDQGFFASKFEIICQLVEDGGRPDPFEWKIIDYTSTMSSSMVDGYITQNSLTGTTFVITLDDYNSAPTYDLSDYINLTQLGQTGYTLNFGDEYYFYGSLETDIQATIYEMRYKINLSQSEFQLSSNPSWTLGTQSYITEIGLFDSDKDLMVVSKLQSPVPRQGVQQLLVKIDF